MTALYRLWILSLFIGCHLLGMTPMIWAHAPQLCGIPLQELNNNHLDSSIEKLLRESCSDPSNETAKLLQSAVLSISPSQRKALISHLSQSHPEAQKRLFNKLSSLSPDEVKEVILRIASLRQASGSHRGTEK